VTSITWRREDQEKGWMVWRRYGRCDRRNNVAALKTSKPAQPVKRAAASQKPALSGEREGEQARAQQ
jgi:hypothetical protein